MNKNLSARRIFVALLFLAFMMCEESLHAACLTLTHPNGGKVWAQGPQDRLEFGIQWSYDTTGNPGPSVKIELLKGGATNTVINYYAPIGNNGKGVFIWTAPVTQANGNDYKIRITSITNPACTDTSDSAFAIYHQIKAVTSPSEGQVLQILKGQHNITWTLEGSYPNNATMNLMLFKYIHGRPYWYGYIAENIPINAGSYMWTIGKVYEGSTVRHAPGDGTTQYSVFATISGCSWR